ncbi:hypothetical protein T439DRAFT_321422 [Meredithblackwellia eburnea MCA 4105]
MEMEVESDKITSHSGGQQHKPRKSSIACLPCRIGKMRCERGESGSSGSPRCRRCSVTGTECTWVPSQRGKWMRRGRTVERQAAIPPSRASSQSDSTSSTSIPSTSGAHYGNTFNTSEYDPSAPRDINLFSRMMQGSMSHSEAQPSRTHLEGGNSSGSQMIVVSPQIQSDKSLNAIGEDSVSLESSNTSNEPRGAPPSRSLGREETDGLLARRHSGNITRDLDYKVDHSFSPLGLLAEASQWARGTRKQRGPVGSATTSPRDSYSTSSPDGGDDTSITSIEGGTGSQEWSDASSLGPANPDYFSTGMMRHLARRSEPGGFEKCSFIKNGILSVSQARELYQIFFDQFNPFINVLDPNCSTAAQCCGKSPFLFSAICAVASRNHAQGILYPLLFQQAQTAGFEAMLSSKTPETCQGFLILASWTPPTSHYEQDNAWTLAGIGIRLATEISLHRSHYLTIPAGLDEETKTRFQSELTNLQRTWICCYNLDRGLSAENGKPIFVQETWEISHVRNFVQQPGVRMGDVWLSAHSGLLRMVSHFYSIIYSSFSSEVSLAATLNFLVLTQDFSHQCDIWAKEYDKRLENQYELTKEESLSYFRACLDFQGIFAKLAITSFGLQHTLIPVKDSFDQVSNQLGYMAPCYQLAFFVIEIAAKRIGPERFRCAPAHDCIKIVFAASLLLKLLSSDYGVVLNEDEVLQKVEEAALLFEKAGAGPKHICTLYALFLRKQSSLYERRPVSMEKEAPNPVDILSSSWRPTGRAISRLACDPLVGTRAASRERPEAPPSVAPAWAPATNFGWLGALGGPGIARAPDVDTNDWMTLDPTQGFFNMESFFPGSSFSQDL